MTTTKDRARALHDKNNVNLIEERESAARLFGMLHVFKRADTTLAGMEVEVQAVNNPYANAPGWSDGKTITFNLPKVGRVRTTEDLIKVTGLNFHELAHIMFTPRVSSWIGNQVQLNGAWHTFNILEDQRIETFMTSRYIATKAYFNMIIMEYLLADKTTWGRQHILLHGRKYLPRKVRDEIRRRFEGPAHVRDRIEELIDEYRHIVFPDDEQRALQIVLEFHSIIKQQQAPVPQDPFGHSSDDRPDMNRAEPWDGEEQTDAESWVDYRDEEMEEEEEQEQGNTGSGPDADSEESDDESDEDGTGGSTDDEGDDEDEGTDEDSAGGGSDSEGDEEEPDDGSSGGDLDDDADDSGDDGDDADADSDSDGDSDDLGDAEGEGDSDDLSDADDGKDGDDAESGSDAGTGGDVPEPDEPQMSDEELEDTLNNSMDDVMSDPEVMSDIRSKEKAIEKTVGKLPQLPVKDFIESTVELPWRKASQAFQKELLRVWADSDPGWNRRQPSGRVNIDRAMQGADIDTVFDTWVEGKVAATDIDMVVLVDYSISMDDQMDAVSQALWAIKRAVEQINGQVTVIGYNEDATSMYSRYDKASNSKYRSFTANGGTDPQLALAEAYTMLMHSRAAHKIVLMLTDGSWSNFHLSNEIIQVLNARGIITVLAFMTDWYMKQRYDRADEDELREQFRHYAKVFALVESPKDLVQVARGVVREAMKS